MTERIARETLGHANIAMTADRYAHPTDGQRRRAAALMEGILGAAATAAATTDASGSAE